MDHSCDCGSCPSLTTITIIFCLHARCICEFDLIICHSNKKKEPCWAFHYQDFVHICSSSMSISVTFFNIKNTKQEQIGRDLFHDWRETCSSQPQPTPIQRESVLESVTKYRYRCISQTLKYCSD